MTLEMNFKHSKSSLILLFTCIFILSACKKKPDPIDDTPPPLPVDLHISATSIENNQYKPYYIQNGKTIALPYEGGSGGRADDIIVVDENVYIAGVLTVGETASKSTHRPVIWKNGQLELLKISDATISASTTALALQDNDVYVAGFRAVTGKKSIGTVWKNGIARNITDGTYEARLQDIFILGSDIYVTGYEKNAKNTPVAKYWKNGKPIELSNGQDVSYAMSIYVDGTDVYVVGYAYENGECNIKLWKNGESSSLTTGANVAMGRKVLINKGDVYVVGYEQSAEQTHLFASKNGNQVINNFSKEGRSIALDAALFENHLFVLGSQTINGETEGTLWQDGIPFLITKDKKDMTLTGLFVTPKPEGD